MGPFHNRQKNIIILCDSKRNSFITYFLGLQFDTQTLIIHTELQNDQARGSKQRFKADLLYVITWYLVGFLCNTIIR